MFDWICNHKMGVLLMVVLALELMLFIVSGELPPW